MVALADLCWLAFLPRPEVRRILPSRLAQGVAGNAQLLLKHGGARVLRATIYDAAPAEITSSPMPWIAEVPPAATLECNYTLHATQRGNFHFGGVRLRWDSPLRLWHRYALAPTEELSQLRVYPNYEPIIRQTLLAVAHQTNIDGIQSRRVAGASRDFHALRDFQEGDSLSKVHWGATSRMQKLITREYRQERNQNVIVAIDCGRRMRAMEDGVPQLDHALNAMLLLSYLALKQGDHVGVLGFGKEQRWLAPKRGSHIITEILEHVADYQSSEVTTDFSQAASYLFARQKQRALIIILTNLRTEDHTELLPAVQLLRSRHLVVIASLRDLALSDAVQHEPTNFRTSISHSAAQLQLLEREGSLFELKAAGADVIDTSAAALPFALAQNYSEIKRRGRL